VEVLFGLLFALVFPIASFFFAWKWHQARKSLETAKEQADILLASAVKAKEKLKTELEAQLATSSQTIRSLSSELEILKAKANPLWQYQGIEDAKAVAEGFLSKAAAEVEKSKEIADGILKDARVRASETKEKAQTILDIAFRESGQIVADAKSRAEDIAGDALKAKENADTYAKKIKAMKNIIDGYGDEYLIAARTLLDDLAEEFSHKEGGVELKKARQFTKTLVKNERYADCDYVEQNRRETAIRFVLDAVNRHAKMTHFHG
jgi:hypothetical protein